MKVSNRRLAERFRVGIPPRFRLALAGVRHLIHRITARLNAESKGVLIAVSWGVAVFPQDGPTMDHALHSARRTLKTIWTDEAVEELASSA